MNRKNIVRSVFYLMLWLSLTVFLLYIVYDPQAEVLPQFAAALIVTGFTVLPAYISSKILVPRLLYRRKTGKFIGTLTLIALLNTALTYFLVGVIYFELSGKSIFTNSSVIQIVCTAFFIVNCLVIIVSSAIQIILNLFGMEQHLHEVEDEKIGTELAFLRAQINPHFLFNVLNTIYFQIQKENTEARSLVEKLSEMLRYQLYECNTDLTDITKELTYIENYVAFQQLRMEPGTDLKLTLPAESGSCRIAPLIILPLVENAFKHLSTFRDPVQNKLHISIYYDPESWFVVHVLNTYNATEQDALSQKTSGLGLQNLERRLSLLYPGKHSLTRKRNERLYETTLKIRICDPLPGG